MIRFVPVTTFNPVTGHRARTVAVISSTRFGIRKHATIPTPEWVWKLLGGRP